MVIVRGPKQSGKTTELIRMAAEHSAYLVVFGHDQAYQATQKAKEMGLDIHFPLTYKEFISGAFDQRGVRGVVIDNVDMLVQYMAGRVPVAAISMTEGPAE